MKYLYVITILLLLSCTKQPLPPNQDHQKLIDQLVSVTQSPDVPLTHNFFLDPEDKRLSKVYVKIQAQKRSIIPALLNNMDREEYSMLYFGGLNHPIRETVGYACKNAFRSYFDWVGIRYKAREANGQYHSCRTYFESMTSSQMKQWWRQHQSKTDMQIRHMIKKWYINHENKIGYSSEKDKKEVMGEIEERFLWSQEADNLPVSQDN